MSDIDLFEDVATRSLRLSHGPLPSNKWVPVLVQLMSELRAKRAADRALADVRRLADVVEGYITRHGRPPGSATVDLIDAIVKYMKERGDA